jgi:hypothetical protein
MLTEVQVDLWISGFSQSETLIRLQVLFRESVNLLRIFAVIFSVRWLLPSWFSANMFLSRFNADAMSLVQVHV